MYFLNKNVFFKLILYILNLRNRLCKLYLISIISKLIMFYFSLFLLVLIILF